MTQRSLLNYGTVSSIHGNLNITASFPGKQPIYILNTTVVISDKGGGRW